MTRQFNFMPSRYVTDASRSERDIGVTPSGQEADKTGTTGGVPLDNQGTVASVSRDTRAANALVTRDSTVSGQEQMWPSMTLEDVKERGREEGLSLLGIPTAHEEARLAGRHGSTWWEATTHIGMKYRTEREIASIRAAFEEGVDLRQRNVRCFCNRCLMPPEIVERERKRWAYAARRHDELTAEGHSPDVVSKRIRDELDRGMAL